MLDKTLTVNVQTSIPLQRLSDLLCSAIEGGSNYWIEYWERHNATRKQAEFLSDVPFVEGAWLELKDNDDTTSGGGVFKINMETLSKGLQIFSDKYPKHFSDFINENDDAITADVFLQCCCFGEAIYG
jgi:hypothetical protein